MASSTTPISRKLALVIGINDYPGPNKLFYCVNDANDVSTKLREIRFQVTQSTDCNKNQFERLIDEFVAKIQSQDLVLFYFAGHGCQFEDKNYLLPAGYSYNHKGTEREHIQNHSICAQYILHEITAKTPQVTLFILDCCRTNVKTRTVQNQRGLAPMTGPPESLMAFSCGFDQGAIDDTQNDRNGIFTEHLLNYLTAPQYDIETALRLVARDIKSKGFPLPWRSSCLTQEVYLATKGNSLFCTM